MRLPNLLDHDTMSEVSQQATSWLPLLNVRCHADSQLFLCSLFAPVCLERPIYPCRSLCNKVGAVQSNPLNGSPDNGSIRLLVQVLAGPILILS